MRSKKKARAKREPIVEIALVGELFEETEKEIIEALLDLPPESELVMYVDSAGGSVYSALAVTTILRSRKMKVTAFVVGECSSAALLVFAACQKRLVTPRSVFLFHRVKWRAEKDIHSDEATNWASHFLWLESEIDRYQADLFGVAPEKLAEWINQSRFVTGPELVAMGIAELVEI